MTRKPTIPRHTLSMVIPLVLAVCAAPASAQGGPPPATVVTDAARMESLGRQRSATGDVRATKRANLASQVEGFVVEFDVNEGDKVRKGQVIAQLDDERPMLDVSRAAAELEAAKASVAERQAEVDRAARDLDRLRELDRDGISSPQELDDAIAADATARATFARAEADVTAAEADLSLANRRLRESRILAPFDGVIVSRLTEVGQWIPEGGSIAEIVATGQIDLWLNVPERYVRFLTEDTGSKASIEISVPSAGIREQATISRIVPVADELSRLFPVVIRMPDRDGVLRPGMSATGLIPTGEVSPVLTVHKDAVKRDDAGQFVFWAPPFEDETNPAVSGIAAVARIERLFGAGDRIAVRADLPPGARVLVEGNERVFPGQPLMITERPAPEGATTRNGG